jgi:hypothetical protein
LDDSERVGKIWASSGVFQNYGTRGKDGGHSTADDRLNPLDKYQM